MFSKGPPKAPEPRADLKRPSRKDEDLDNARRMMKANEKKGESSLKQDLRRTFDK